MIKGIVCIGANNGVMGKDGSMPWGDKPLDGQHFRELTQGHTVVMGRKTWESMGSKPLPGRHNLVVTRKGILLDYQSDTWQTSITEVLYTARKYPERTFWILGGAEMFKAFLPHIEEMYVTTVGDTFEGDTFFPNIHEGYSWQGEFLGMETREFATIPEISVMAEPSPTITMERLPTNIYNLIYRKFTKQHEKRV